MKYYITTAIPYANGAPHIGHAVLFLYADVMARYERLLGKDVYFLIGTDEHGQKMLRSAAENNLSVEKFAAEKSALFQGMADEWNISNSDFIRTTEKRHIEAAQKIWSASLANGDIYKKSYTGLYCVGCEAFKTDKDLVDGLCPDHQKAPEYLEEENYFFKLSKFQKPLEDLLKNNPDFNIPSNRLSEMQGILKAGLEDISVSRSKDKLSWGIPVPNDPNQVMYVWFDALTNYVTALGYGSADDSLYRKYWPADCHVLGKEINRFHTLLWPAMLLSAGIPLPKQIMAHGWFTVNGQKMSKSIGNVIDPRELVVKYPLDAVRYFFMRELAVDNDGDYSEDKFFVRFNADLANGLGNLTNRIIVMIHKYAEGIIPKEISPDEKLQTLSTKTWKKYREAMAIFRFDHALETIWQLIAMVDGRITETTPWSLAKTGKIDDVKNLLANWAEALRQIAMLISPIMPETAEKILSQLGLSWEEENKKLIKELSQWRNDAGVKIGESAALFPRLER